MYNWQDLRFFLAVHREGNLTRAAGRLRVDATTVSRRISALEEDLGQPLFKRGRPEWTLTPLGIQVLPAAERVEDAALAVGRTSDQHHEEPEGSVRLTTLDVLATNLVAPALPRLYARHPKLRVDVLCTPHTLDLHRGEADLALRTTRPTEVSLKARRAASATERPYAKRSLLEAYGLDESLDTVRGLPVLVNYTDEAWVFAMGGRLALRTSSANVLIAAALSGTGVAMLPDVIASAHPDLVPLHGLDRVRERPLWIVMHRDLAKVARIRAVADFLAETLSRGRLMGTAS